MDEEYEELADLSYRRGGGDYVDVIIKKVTRSYREIQGNIAL